MSLKVYSRRQMMGVKPYDAELEYLESNGNQYIDSGVECTGDLEVQFECMFFSMTNAAICGGISNASGSTYFRHHCTPSNNKGFYFIQYNSSGNSSVGINSSINTWYNVNINPINGVAYINGTIHTFSRLSASLRTYQNYYIFARKAQSGAIQSKPSRFKSFIMKRDNNILRNFIPVRKGSIGYMYDMVSGELFRNQGSGSFTLGPDKL